jgi:hypothetical protein
MSPTKGTKRQNLHSLISIVCTKASDKGEWYIQHTSASHHSNSSILPLRQSLLKCRAMAFQNSTSKAPCSIATTKPALEDTYCLAAWYSWRHLKYKPNAFSLQHCGKGHPSRNSEIWNAETCSYQEKPCSGNIKTIQFSHDNIHKHLKIIFSFGLKD